MSANTYYALLCYNNSFNLGDTVQSFAARQYLPRVDAYLDRDTGRLFTDDGTDITSAATIEGRRYKVIVNGWFNGNYTHMPYPSFVDPIFISYHIDVADHTGDACYEPLKVFETAEDQNLFDPKYYNGKVVGCRDQWTYKTMLKTGNPCYFSGCLTLTLNRPVQTHPETEGKIVVVDAHQYVPDLFNKLIPQAVRESAVYLYQGVSELYNIAEKNARTETFLRKLAGAKCVITSRIHTALPCVAMQIPVVYLSKDPADHRITGLTTFFPLYTSNSDSIPINFDTFTWEDLKKMCPDVDNTLPTLQQMMRTRIQKFISQ